jgi:hypothetical protein
MMRVPLIPFAIALSFSHSFAMGFGEPDVPDTLAKLAPIQSMTPGLEKLSPRELAYTKELYANGQSKQLIGRGMSWGGIGLMTVAGIANQPALATVGFLSMMAGIPVNGSGASDMVHGVNQMNDRVKIEMTGWSAYIASCGTMAAGMVLIGASKGDKDGLSMAGLVLTTGAGLQFFAWDQFSGSADRASVAHEFSPYSLQASPSAYRLRDGSLVPGMNLALTF